MEYARFTWRLPLPPQNKQRLCDDLLTSNSIFPLTDDIGDAAQLHADLAQLGSRRSEKATLADLGVVRPSVSRDPCGPA